MTGDLGGGDRVTEVTSTGWLQSIVGSFVGVLVGFVMVAGTIILLYWNEGRAVQAYEALDRGQRAVVEVGADAVAAGDEGKLVHLVGALATKKPAQDPVFKVGGEDTVRVRRTVEMYQWTEHESQESHRELGGSTRTETTYSYTQEWADHPIDSSHFHVQNGHQNPPMPLRSTDFNGPGATLGAYKLDHGMLGHVQAWTPLTLPDAAAGPAGFERSGDQMVRARSPDGPTVGDVRVSFSEVAQQTYSMVAQLTNGMLVPYHDQTGYEIALAAPGSVPAAALFKEKKQEEGMLTWILRGVGFVLMLIGFILIARPVAVLVSVLPIFETIADAGIFLIALALAVPVTLLTIAIAWFTHRPVLSLVLIAAAVLAYVAVHRMHAGRKRLAAA